VLAVVPWTCIVNTYDCPDERARLRAHRPLDEAGSTLIELRQQRVTGGPLAVTV
jgi:hypothetical protein